MTPGCYAGNFQPRRVGPTDVSLKAARQVPSVGELLQSVEVNALSARYGRAQTREALRAELAGLRARLLHGEPVGGALELPALAARVGAQLDARRSGTLVSLINCTGVILHTNLGRAPVARSALAAALEAGARYSNLEFDLERGGRGSRTAHVEPVLCRLTGAEAALVVNNGAAAVLLVLSALARGGEVVTSRGELVEIGGGFRIPEVIAQSGARLVEVGTTNRTRLADYEAAIGPDTRVILKSHTSNYRILGFTESVERAALAALAEKHGLPLVEDLGSGTLVDLARFGLPGEPSVQECVRGGAHAVCFSGDKLLGGPQAGIVLGRRELVATLRKHPLLRALRVDKLTLGALCATLALYENDRALREVPVLRMLGAPLPELRRRARRVIRGLYGLPGVLCAMAQDQSLPGGGSLPLATLPTAVVRLCAQHLSCAALAKACLAQRPAVVGRVRDGALVLDMRTVADDEVRPLVSSLKAALA